MQSPELSRMLRLNVSICTEIGGRLLCLALRLDSCRHLLHEGRAATRELPLHRDRDVGHGKSDEQARDGEREGGASSEAGLLRPLRQQGALGPGHFGGDGAHVVHDAFSLAVGDSRDCARGVAAVAQREDLRHLVQLRVGEGSQPAGPCLLIRSSPSTSRST